MSENWLAKAVTEGIQGLLALRLQGAPADDTVTATAKVWIIAIETWPIAWDEQLDRPRIKTAFRTLAANCDRWPAPKNLRDALPPRPEQKKLNAPTSTKMPLEICEKLNAFLAKSKAA